MLQLRLVTLHFHWGKHANITPEEVCTSLLSNSRVWFALIQISFNLHGRTIFVKIEISQAFSTHRAAKPYFNQ